MNQAPDKPSGELLTLSEVVSLTGVRKSTLRHWEREFSDFLKSVRTKGNQRRFTLESVRRIEKIKELVEEQGLTLRGVRLKLERVVSPDADAPASDPALHRLAELMSEHVIRRLFYDK